MKQLRFIQISDTHIGPTPDFELYGLKPYPWLAKLVDEINSLPFTPDFILHSGDVVDGGEAEAYQLAKRELSRLKYPLHVVAGNHDDPDPLRTILLNQTPAPGRLDRMIDLAGFRLVTLDTRGPVSPGGFLETPQLEWLRSICESSETDLILAMHHQPLPLDTPWLDFGGKSWGGLTMIIQNHEELRRTIAPFARRIRAILFGHVHGSFTIHRDGILYCACQSSFAPLQNWPGKAEALLDTRQAPGYNIITVDQDQVLIRHRTLIT